MARVTYGSGVTELAGSIGGVTYQKNASGNIAKLRANPTVNPTALQEIYQTRMAMLVSYWPTLSQEDKDTWNALAASHNHTTPWGEIKTLSGYQWFLSSSLKRLLYYPTFSNTAPTWEAQSPPDQFIIETSDTYIRAAWSPDYDAPNDLIAYVSLPLRQSSLKLRRSLFFIKTYLTAPALTNWDLTTEIAALFNVTWSTFFHSSDCNIVIRLSQGRFSRGLFSTFTSAIVKI